MQTLVQHARDGGLVLFAGAGISMPPPSSLPSWWDINEVVLESFARRIEAFTPKEFAEDVHRQLVATRNDTTYFSPDYQAQIIEDECGPDYFRVLQALDAEEWNGCHAAIAALAKRGFVAAVVTTNFDRLLERALDASGVECRVYRNQKEYESLKFGEGPLPVVKVHGSAEAPESMVDTLRQRLRGRPEALERAIAELLKRHHVLFAGFSGADLAHDEGYLSLRAAASENRGFTCLVRPGTRPHPAMDSLKRAWGKGARFKEALLPDWFDGLLKKLKVDAPQPVKAEPVDRRPALAAHADRWAVSLGHMVAVSIMAELLESTGRRDLAYEVLVKTYNSGGELRDPEAKGYFRYNYQLGRRLLDRGEFGFPIDSLRRRQAEREPSLSRFHASDCYQCLQRGQAGDFADAHIAIGWYEALQGYPQTGAERLRALRGIAERRGAVLAFVDACRTLAVIYEILMQYADGLDWLERAHTVARAAGDDPRRARVCAEMVRFLATKHCFDEANEMLREGWSIAQRLELDLVRFELLSAEGSLLATQRRGSEALDRLKKAIEGFDKLSYRPSALRAMLDVGYAAHQATSQESLDWMQARIGNLADLYPGYGPQVALMFVRLDLRIGNEAGFRYWVKQGLLLASENQNPGVAEEIGIQAKKWPG